MGLITLGLSLEGSYKKAEMEMSLRKNRKI